jgi:nicotinamide-nucleotide amidase
MPAADDRRLGRLAQRVGEACLRAQRSLATAESCTGGLIAKCLTDIPGSSAWFERGWVTYSNAAKADELGVAATLIARHGAVSEAVARAMARGALAGSPAQRSVAVTGIAGPDGGAPGKPVGTVWIAWAERQGRRIASRAVLHRFRGSRDDVRRRTTEAALRGLLLDVP